VAPVWMASSFVVFFLSHKLYLIKYDLNDLQRWRSGPFCFHQRNKMAVKPRRGAVRYCCSGDTASWQRGTVSTRSHSHTLSHTHSHTHTHTHTRARQCAVFVCCDTEQTRVAASDIRRHVAHPCARCVCELRRGSAWPG